MRRAGIRLLAALVLVYAVAAHAAVTVTVNGTSHSIPQTNEKGWGANVTAWIQAISANTLQPSGGSFTLTADTDFGANFGLKSIYFKSRALNLPTSGVLRLGNTEAVGWRNAANSGNLLLTVNASDQLTFNGNPILGSTALTASRALQTDGSGLLSASSVTSTELGLLSGRTGTLVTTGETQTLTSKTLTAPIISTISNTGTLTLPTSTDTLIGRATTDTLTNKTIAAGSNTITGLTNSNLDASAAIARSKVATGTASHVVINDGSGNLSSEAQLAISRGGTGQATASAAFDALSPNTTKGDITVRGASGSVRLAVGSDNTFLKANSSATNGVEWASASLNLSVVSKTSAYTLTTSDDVVLGSASGAGFTLTLPTAVGNSGKTFRIKKTDSTFNVITIDGNASETLDGAPTLKLSTQNEEVVFTSDNANWAVVGRRIPSVWTSYTPTITNISGFATGPNGYWRREGDSIHCRIDLTKNGSGGAGGSSVTFSLPSGLTIDTGKMNTGGASAPIGYADTYNLSASAVYASHVVQYAGASAVLIIQTGTAAGVLASAVSSGAYLALEFEVPITNWEG